jgi:hypothetical protein
MFYNVCYDGKEYNGVLRESKRNAEIQIIENLLDHCVKPTANIPKPSALPVMTARLIL